MNEKTNKQKKFEFIVLAIASVFLVVIFISVLIIMPKYWAEYRKCNELRSTFEALCGKEYQLSSQGGVWSTTIVINSDGTFSGEYYDYDALATGENYPYGTLYESSFTGEFSGMKKVDEYTYYLYIKDINYQQEVGAEEIIDQVLHIRTEAYGLTGVERLIVYIPGTPADSLPENVRIQCNESMLNRDGSMLQVYVLYNEELGVMFR